MLNVQPLVSAALAVAMLLGSGHVALASAVPAPVRTHTVIAPLDTDPSCVSDEDAVPADGDETGETGEPAAVEDEATVEPAITFDPIMDDEEPATVDGDDATEDEAASDDGTVVCEGEMDEDVPPFDASVACADLGSVPSMRVLCSLYSRGLPAGAAAAIERVITIQSKKVAPGWMKMHTFLQAELRTEQVERREEQASAKDQPAGERNERKPGKSGQPGSDRERPSAGKPADGPGAAAAAAAKGKRS